MENLYEMPSGMGGSFTVKIVEDRCETVVVQVHMPGNPDWHGHTLAADRLKLKPAGRMAS